MESSPETTITQAFNPFVATQQAYGMGATGLIYEPLIQFDLASPTVSYPWLATSYAWSNGDKTITFTIRQGVKWNNGTPLTPADVAFTFNLVKNNTSINSGGLNISSVSTSGNTVTLNVPDIPVHQPGEDRWPGDRAPVAVERPEPGDLHGPEPGRHGAVHAEPASRRKASR